MKVFLYIAIILLPFTSVAQSWRWGVGSGGDCDAVSIALDKNGNTYGACQLFDGSTVAYFGIDTLVSTAHIAVVSVDPYGHYRWEKGGSSPVGAFIGSIATDTMGNIYVFGYYYSSLTMGAYTITTPGAYYSTFCAKLNAAGSVLWLRNIVDTVLTGCVGGVDYDGNIYVAGTFYSAHLTIGTSTFTNHGLNDCFVAKYDASGTPVWAHTFGGARQEMMGCISVTGEGRVCVGGQYLSPVLYIGTDTFTAPLPDTAGLFLVSYDAHGNQVWAKGMRSPGSQCALGSTCFDQWNNIYFDGGYSVAGGKLIIDTADSVQNAGPNPIVVKFDSTGDVVWAHGNFSSRFYRAANLAIDSFTNVWVSGFYGAATGSSDSLYMLRMDTAGNVNDSVLLAAGGDDAAPIAVDNRGGLYIVDDYGIDEFAIGSDTLRLIDVSMESLYFAKYCYFNCMTEAVSQPPPAAEILLYPNPAATELTIRSAAEITKLTISDLLDQPVMTSNNTSGANEVHVDVASLPAGMYIINIDGHRPKKFIKL